MGKHSNQPKQLQQVVCLIVLTCSILAACVPTPSRTPRQVADTEVVLKTLAYVPNTPAAFRSNINYINYAAILETRGMTTMTYEEFFASHNHWGIANREVQSDLSTIEIGIGPQMEELMGFSLMDIDREVSFAGFPNPGAVLIGRFDPQQIEIALGKRGYDPNTVSDLPAQCATPDCEPLFIEPPRAEHGNLFRGSVARRDPIYVSSDAILSSGDFDTFGDMLLASRGETESIASDPRTVSLVDAAASQGTILQMRFFWARYTGSQPVPTHRTSATSVPDYSEVAIAHLADGDKQIGAILSALSVDSGQATEEANNIHQWILEAKPFPNDERTLLEMINDRGGTLEDPMTYRSPVTGRYVAMVLISYQPQSLDSDPREFSPRGIIYHLLFDVFLVGF